MKNFSVICLIIFLLFQNIFASKLLFETEIKVSETEKVASIDFNSTNYQKIRIGIFAIPDKEKILLIIVKDGDKNGIELKRFSVSSILNESFIIELPPQKTSVIFSGEGIAAIKIWG